MTRNRTEAQIQSESKRDKHDIVKGIRLHNDFWGRLESTLRIRKIPFSKLVKDLLNDWLEHNEI